VLFGPGDVREITLDQVDDFFRLGLIDQGTLLWTEGMDAWQTLGDAAGLGGSEAQRADAQPSPSSGSRSTPPPPQRRAPPPPARVHQATAQVAGYPAPDRRSVQPSGNPNAMNRPTTRRSAIVATAPEDFMPRTQTRVAPAATTLQPFQQPVSFAPPSVTPMVRDTLDSVAFGRPAGRLRRRVQGSLLALSLLAGAFITLYRNDLLLVWAQSVRQEPAYLAFEKQWLGGAPNGTPREVDALFGRSSSAADGSSLSGSSLLGAAVLPSPLQGSQSSDAPAQREGSGLPERSGAAEATVIADNVRTDDVGTPSAADPTSAAPAVPMDVSSLPKVASSRGRVSASARNSRSAEPTKESLASSRASEHGRSARDSDADEPSKKKEPSSEPAPRPGTDDFLNASIRQAVEQSKSKKSKKKDRKSKKSSSFDPLNGEI
jgi:hypothetical protein